MRRGIAVKRKGSCVAPKQRIAVVPTMPSPLKVPKTAETERGGILQLRIFWRQSETMEAAKWKKLIARFLIPPIPDAGG